MFRFLDYIFCGICRGFRTLGFGVQSPFAYHFIREVIKGRNGFSPMTEGSNRIKKNRQLRKLGSFYYRFSCFFHPSVWYISSKISDIYRQYIQEGSPGTRIEILTLDITAFSVALVSGADDSMSFCNHLLEIADDHSILILEGIHDDSVSMYWNQLVADNRTFVTFDLYYCGIIFFDKKMYKKNYKVNL